MVAVVAVVVVASFSTELDSGPPVSFNTSVPVEVLNRPKLIKFQYLSAVKPLAIAAEPKNIVLSCRGSLITSLNLKMNQCMKKKIQSR